jgi:exonuclease SbcD
MPFRLIHTADWHLGQSLRGYSRDFEHAAVLAHLVTLTSETKPDALIIAGDVFDSPNPSAEAQTLFFRTLVRLHQSCPGMTIVVTAGNHDAAIRLEAPRDLLATIGVHIVGNVRRLNGRTLNERHLVPILSPSGIQLGHILAVSYPTAACLPAVPAADGSSRLITAVEHLYADLVHQTRSQWEGLPLILTGHLHVSGAVQSDGAERPILIGGENAIPASKFPTDAAYIALGHLHKPQAAGAPHIRYSGSLIPLSASEIDYQHGVTLLEIDGASTTIQHLPLPRPVPFHRLPSSGFASQSELPDLLNPLRGSRNAPPDQRPFVYVRLRREGLGPAFREDIDNLAFENGLRVLEIRLEDPPVNHTINPDSIVPSRTVIEHDPVEFFRLAFLRTHQKDPDPAHSEIFQKVYEEAHTA